jgi:hypothetical protein
MAAGKDFLFEADGVFADQHGRALPRFVWRAAFTHAGEGGFGSDYMVLLIHLFGLGLGS